MAESTLVTVWGGFQPASLSYGCGGKLSGIVLVCKIRDMTGNYRHGAEQVCRTAGRLRKASERIQAFDSLSDSKIPDRIKVAGGAQQHECVPNGILVAQSLP
jgi:hypothetical protein